MVAASRHRTPGTGSIQAHRGWFQVYTPFRSGERTYLGQFGSRWQAERALEKWLRENPEPGESGKP